MYKHLRFSSNLGAQYTMSHFWSECVARGICHYVSYKIGVAMGLTRAYIRGVGFIKGNRILLGVITDFSPLIYVTPRLSVIFETI